MMEPQEVSKFASYLTLNGAEVRANTNPWELIRYHLEEVGTIVVYQNSKGGITWGPHAEEHYRRFKTGKALETHRRAGKDAKARLIAKLKERDGDVCCFCGQFLLGDESVEHWLSIAHGGNNLPENTALAHTRCNQAADSMSVMEKIELRDMMRAEVSKAPPWELVPPELTPPNKRLSR